MGFSLVLATVLCFTTLMTSVHTTNGPLANCCITWSNTRVPVERIVNYTIQPEGICPIKAIVFLTKLGKSVCSDPNTDWAIRARNKVDKETKALLVKGQNKEGSTIDTTTPAVSTAPTKAPIKAPIKAPQKKSFNGNGRRRRLSKKKGSRGSRRWRREWGKCA